MADAPQRLSFPGSSYLARGTYDPTSRVLTVEFRSGAVCEHSGVPRDIVDELEAGGGSFYRQVLYGQFGARDL